MFTKAVKFNLLIVAIFLLTRVFIWTHPPTAFTEIIYSYMPYAHLWASGTRPYLDQWYEYPPATIPLFYIPHLIDMKTLDTPIHLTYSNAYRLQLLIIDSALFGIIWYGLMRMKAEKKVIVLSLLYYSLVTAKAHHFIYDTMDIVFAAGLTLSALTPTLTNKNTWGYFGVWIGFFMATALKYINAPLGILIAWLGRKDWKKHGIAMVLAGVLVWSVPLVVYRSSLSVSLVYHQIRGLQVDSAAGIVVRTIDAFTNSEEVIEVYKNYELTGPYAKSALDLLSILFPLSLISYTAYIMYRYKNERLSAPLMVWITFGYVLVFMLCAKVLSTPFLLWHIPLLAAVPFKKITDQLSFMIVSAIIVATSMSLIPQFSFGIFSSALMVGWIRTAGFLWMFCHWIRLTRYNNLIRQ